MFKNFALAGLLYASLISAVSASTYSVSTAISGTNEMSFFTPVFNPDFGTLSAVSLAFSGLLTTSIPHIDTVPQPGPFTATLKNDVSGIGGGWVINPPLRLADSAGQGSGASFSSGPISVAFSVVAGDLTEYKATKPVDGFLRFTSSFLGDTRVSGDTYDAFRGSVLTTFTYTSVPEPATMAVLGAGMMGLAFVRRRA